MAVAASPLGASLGPGLSPAFPLVPARYAEKPRITSFPPARQESQPCRKILFLAYSGNTQIPIPNAPPSSIASARSAIANSTGSATGWPPTWPGAASPGATCCPCWPNARPNWPSPSWRPPSAQRPTYRWTVDNPTGASGNPPPMPGPLGPRHPGRGPAGATGGGHRTGARDECSGCRAETGARRQRSAVCDLHLGHHRRTQGRGDRESLPGQPRGLAQPALRDGPTEPHHPDGRRRLRRFPMGNLVHPVRRRLPPPGARRGAPRPDGAAGILRRAADQPRLRAYRDGARAGGAARPAVAGATLPVLRRGKTAAGRNRRAALYRGGLLRPDRGHGLRHLPHRRRRSTSATRLDRHAHRRLRGIHPRRRRPALPWRPTR